MIPMTSTWSLGASKMTLMTTKLSLWVDLIVSILVDANVKYRISWSILDDTNDKYLIIGSIMDNSNDKFLIIESILDDTNDK